MNTEVEEDLAIAPITRKSLLAGENSVASLYLHDPSLEVDREKIEAAFIDLNGHAELEEALVTFPVELEGSQSQTANRCRKAMILGLCIGASLLSMAGAYYFSDEKTREDFLIQFGLMEERVIVVENSFWNLWGLLEYK